MLPLKQSVTQTGLQRLFLHKLQGDHMWSQTSSYLRSWDLTLPHTILNCKIYIKSDKRNLFHWISCFILLAWFDIAEIVREVGPFPGSQLWSLPALPATVGLAVPSWEGCGARACKPLWGWGSWHHRICGSEAGCQATRAPFFFWKKTRFLNTKMLH